MSLLAPGKVHISEITSPDDNSVVVTWAAPAQFAGGILSYNVSILPVDPTKHYTSGEIVIKNATLTATRLSKLFNKVLSISSIFVVAFV